MTRPKQWVSNTALTIQGLSIMLIIGHLMWWAEHLERHLDLIWIGLLALIGYGSSKLVYDGYYDEDEE